MGWPVGAGSRAIWHRALVREMSVLVRVKANKRGFIVVVDVEGFY